MSPREFTPEKLAEMWGRYLTTGEVPNETLPFGLTPHQFRRLMDQLPSAPRCMSCHAPFAGVGGQLMRLFDDKKRSKLNPNLCNSCEKFLSETGGGAEVELSMLFADVRGSTALAESMPATEFKNIISRFYNTATNALVKSMALVEKLMGDEVTGLFMPGLAGQNHAGVAIDTAREILRLTGHGDPEGPWVPVGVGVHTGRAYVGAVGGEGGMVEIAALGDDVNVAARLAGEAAIAEVVVSEAACAAAGDSNCDGEARSLTLKGKGQPVDVRVLRLGAA